jgi:hypothetical protein
LKHLVNRFGRICGEPVRKPEVIGGAKMASSDKGYRWLQLVHWV